MPKKKPATPAITPLKIDPNGFAQWIAPHLVRNDRTAIKSLTAMIIGSVDAGPALKKVLHAIAMDEKIKLTAAEAKQLEKDLAQLVSGSE